METRPYRLSWPRSSVIYDISPGTVFQEASQRLEGVGAKISKACLLLHVPLESLDIQKTLCKKGFSGAKPSIWVLQGLPLMTLMCFEDLLSIVSSLTMEGSIFVGEVPGSLLEADLGNMSSKADFLEKLFMKHGFKVDVVEYVDIARNLHLDPPSGDHKGVVFVARQLLLSDAQMDMWREHFIRLDEEGDEDGFEEL